MSDLEKKIKVLIVDDSSLIRRVLADVINEHPKMEVIGYAMNGRMALRQLEALEPDIMTLDVEMPFMNGLETLKEVKNIKDIPVIMFSSLTASGAEVTIQALELGAFDFLQKPESIHELEIVKNDIYTKILLAVESSKAQRNSVATRNLIKAKSTTQAPVVERVIVNKPVTKKITRVKTVVIGTSTGGPQALKEVVPYLPPDLPAQILIVQHMPPKFTEMLAQRLNNMSKIEVREAKEGDELQAQLALLAPGGYHMCVNQSNRIVLNQDPPLWGVRPAVDITLASSSQVFKEDLISVILTGMGHDGRDGCGVVRKNSGYCIAEDKSTSVIYGMPKSVIDAGHANEIVPLHEVANAIVKAVYR